MNTKIGSKYILSRKKIDLSQTMNRQRFLPSFICSTLVAFFVFIILLAKHQIPQRNLQRSSDNFVRKIEVDPNQDSAQSIIGGTAAGIGEFPWYAKFEGNILCGGAVIGNGQFIVTAAHCVENYTPSQVRVGSNTFSSDGTTYRVTNKWIHPQFKQGGFLNNDIALLKIATTCCIRSPKTIALNNNTNFPSTTGESLTVMGFGVYNFQNVPSSLLRKLGVQYIANDECASKYGDFAQNIKLCANKVNAGVCAGDSGSPLVYKDADGKSLVVGIVSYGRDRCASDYPDYYTRVSAYADGWIQQTMDGEMAAVGSENDSLFRFIINNRANFKWVKELRIWN